MSFKTDEDRVKNMCRELIATTRTLSEVCERRRASRREILESYDFTVDTFADFESAFEHFYQVYLNAADVEMARPSEELHDGPDQVFDYINDVRQMLTGLRDKISNSTPLKDIRVTADCINSSCGDMFGALGFFISDAKMHVVQETA